MADEGQVIRGIDWRNTFSFTHIFRSFRVAIHLSKLALGLALLLTIYFGGRIMDAAWPARARAIPGEVAEYERIAAGTDQTTLGVWRDQRQNEIDQAYAQRLLSYKLVPKTTGETDDAYQARVLDQAKKAEYLSDVKAKILSQRDAAVTAAQKQYATATDPNAKPPKTEDQKAALLRTQNAAIVDAYAAATADWGDAQSIKGLGLFHTFFQYEIFQITGIVNDGVLRNNWLDPGGVKDHGYNFFAIGPIWLIWNHTIFFIIFAALFLLAWALFGGAICRIAAVHFARDEKISVRQAMNFAVGKLLSFGSAPVIPLAIVLVIGLIVSLVSLAGNIPFLGPVAIGAFFILPLLAGFVMTLVLLGTAGGFNLMYPTIAVEGSDSFDAISRSFSYVYARPWRMLFYTVVALVYGAATYLFVHTFIWLTLVLTHHFVGMGMFTTANNSKDLLSTMWPNPLDTGRLSYSADYSALAVGPKIGAFFMNCWVMFLVSFLGAFAISLYFSANTIVYYLMRNEVDSTELDDVYLEQSEEDLEPVMGASPVVAVTTETVVVTETTPGESQTGDSPQPT
jgi:hypothetical protein